ncbi:MAG: hypothetical protein LBC76_08085 [Treponema sp.]|jgi:hypothetical protein|nr:hypothetical protein [Treponema sp.]
MKNGGQVFPTQTISHYRFTEKGEGPEPVYETKDGMCLRDYIATQNMPELLKMSWEIYKNWVSGKSEEAHFATESLWIKMAAELSYKAADALLAEMEKEQ